MFIDNIYDQNIYTNIDFLDTNKQKNKKSNNFINHFQKALGEISNIQNNSKKNIEKFQSNHSDISLNDIMINLQKSSISIELAIQVRNRIISAYKEIMNQQI
ncbi:flagellar hook-basal body complex protein FliE [Buchnera aphidicola]|jgi:flagellar hook-basal body complex protein FliE|uniref:Flagellar hook-basal body complex protein FliE n=1 Tax=Buchnera aphidicola subsp. Schizaphis graminum (strain Sg) TaxID=198804 RepID=FLIE_BUCAP|nr:flagellar hook-basal body complex protein FliE [Buchnera aphidicola]Q8KA46.1 RecName: Full=Flagellar hook-basal body complex protein FliE [Buchnera aphidicola str. Sg (Schizaphis graminum)]AAM67636.1 flagellar hook-basal body complex protein FliE [Buchnera aphidicola str. Sg (Schizaphis graminum)]AWI49867.1 flagellar hook-basal body complex protein FliE [Buchnera aphidicola (Schizaphis graminum)]